MHHLRDGAVYVIAHLSCKQKLHPLVVTAEHAAQTGVQQELCKTCRKVK